MAPWKQTEPPCPRVGGGGKEQPQTEQNVPVPLLAQNPTQNYHLPEQSIWLKGEKDACPEKNVSNRGVEMKPNQTLRCYDS